MLTYHSWIGDPARVLMSKAVVEEILNKNLVEQCVSCTPLLIPRIRY